MVKPLVVIGSQGQLAKAVRYFRPDAVFLDRSMVDLAFPDTILPVLQRYDTTAIINTAAYTQVDNAEKEEGLAFAVNADAPGVIARFCASEGIPFIHFSSDYVFNGEGERPWTEGDATAPLNVYGRSKVAGEEQVAGAGGKYLIFRTSWLYDNEGKNFLNTILRLASEHDELRVIDDQFGAPTYATHLAAAVSSAMEKANAMAVFPSGIYHLCNSGVTTWHGFASRIVALAKEKSLPVTVKKIIPIPASQYPLPARRPHNSRLDCGKARKVFGLHMPSWEEGVRDCMALQ